MRAYEDTLDALCDVRAQTMAGLVAKARAAKAEAIGPEGDEQIEFYSVAGQWAWDLVNDVLRLSGSVSA